MKKHSKLEKHSNNKFQYKKFKSVIIQSTIEHSRPQHQSNYHIIKGINCNHEFFERNKFHQKPLQ